jgi:hypothetical protein|tara:strand:+ start:559 stop:858 length:300 start_codon:yes stop_codon:yes gene_type:complete
MKKIYFILFSLIFLKGCSQNLSFLAPAFSVVKTGGIQDVLIGNAINYGIKNNTGKNVGEHAMSLLPDGVEIQDCDNIYSNDLQKVFFEKSETSDCKKIQ